MDPRRILRGARNWRDRLAARTVYDVSAAEAAIREAYRASALREPNQVWWVKGPNDAAKMIAFLGRPPQTQLRDAWAVVAMGAVAALALTVGFDSNVVDGPTPMGSAALWSAIVAGAGLAVGITPRLPDPPGRPDLRHDRKLVVAGAACSLVLAAYAFVLQRAGGLPNDPMGRDLALAMAAAAGALPGVFLHFRVSRAYAGLAPSLVKCSSSASIAHRMERVRARAWAPFERAGTGPRPDETLLQAYQTAHWDAFARQQALLFGSGELPRAIRHTDWDGVGWIGGSVFRSSHTRFGLLPPHFDGIEDAARASAVDCAGAIGPAECFAGLAFQVDRLYPSTATAVAVQPPTTVALDAEGRPHAEDGPALEWPDGTQLYAWHGRLVPRELIDSAQPVTFSRVSSEQNQERRSVLIERYGLGRYLLDAGAVEIHCDACGKLYRLDQAGGEPILAVRVVNRTPEPDGSFREFWLRVPPTVTTARQAVAWTFGMRAADYDPVAQS